MRRLVLDLVLVLALVFGTLGGCKKKDDSGDKAEGGGGKAGGQVVSAPTSLARETPVLQGLAALEHLPKTTLAVGAADGIAPWLDRLGYAQLREKYRQHFAKASAEIMKVAGYDLLDPKNLAEIGIDPLGSVGFAIVDIETVTYAFWATMTDAEKLEKVLVAIGKAENDELTVEAIEGGKLLRLPKDEHPKGGFILKNGLALAVFSERYGTEVDPLDAFVKLSKADSLAGSERMKTALARLGYGAQATFFMDFSGLLQSAGQHVGKMERMLLDKIAGEAWFAFGLGLKEKSVLMKALYGFGKDSLLSKIWKTRPNPVRMVQATRRHPIYLFSAAMDVPAIWKTVQEITRDMGGDAELTAASAASEELLSMGIEGVVGLFTGEIAFAITGKPTPAMDANPEQLKEEIGGNALIGITDAAKVNQIVNVITSLGPVKELVKKEGDTFVIPIPQFKNAYVRVSSDWIAASTDRAFLDRAEKGGGAGFAADLENAQLRDLMTRGETAGIGLFDYSMLGWFVLMGKMDTSPPHEGESPERKALREQIEKQEAALDKERNGAFLAFASKLGLAGGSFWPEDGILHGTGGLYLGETPASMIERGIELAIRSETEWQKRENELWEMRNKLWEMAAQGSPAAPPF